MALAAAFIIFCLWIGTHPDATPVNVAVPATPAPEVAKTPTVATPVEFKAVKAYPKTVKNKLGLPEPVQTDDNKLVIDASQLPADTHTQTTACVLDKETGEAQLYVRRDPSPWFALDFSGDAGMYFGFKNGVQTIRLEARQSVFAIKEIRLGGIVSLDQPISSMQIAPSSSLLIGAWGNW